MSSAKLRKILVLRLICAVERLQVSRHIKRYVVRGIYSWQEQIKKIYIILLFKYQTYAKSMPTKKERLMDSPTVEMARLLVEVGVVEMMDRKETVTL